MRLLTTISLLTLLASCQQEAPKNHQHNTTTTTADTTNNKPATTLPPADKSKQLVFGGGFGWKRGELNSLGTSSIELSLSYKYKILSDAALCKEDTKTCLLSAFTLNHEGKELYRFPSNKNEGQLAINLDTHELPCLLRKGEQVAILLPVQRASTEKSITLDLIKIDAGKVTWLEKVAPYEGHRPDDTALTAIFDAAFK